MLAGLTAPRLRLGFALATSRLRLGFDLLRAVICVHNRMQLKFGYDLKPKMWDESGGYAFSIVFRVEILRKRRAKEWKDVLKMTGVLQKKMAINCNMS